MICRGQTGVAAFGRDRDPAARMRDQGADTETGARSEHRDRGICHCVVRSADRDPVCWLQAGDRHRHSDEVVDQREPPNTQFTL